MLTSIRVYFLGTGGSWPTPIRGTAAVAVRLDDEAILFDCGEYTQVRLMKSSLSLMKISKIFITHFHGDHFLGLPGLIQTMSLFGRKEPLEIYGPRGAVEIISSLLSIGYFDLPFEIKVGELWEEGELDFGEYKIMYMKSNHTVPSISYSVVEKDTIKFDEEKIEKVKIPRKLLEKIRKNGYVEYEGRIIKAEDVSSSIRKGRKISYSGDTRKDLRLTKLFENSTLLIHEATGDMTLVDKVRTYGHSTGQDAAEIAELSKSRRLVLIHFSPRYDDISPIVEEARKIFKNTEASNDLLELEVKLSDV